MMVRKSDKPPIEAAELVSALREHESRIPHYTQLTKEQIVAMRRAATLDPEWIVEAVHLLGQASVLQQAVGCSSEELLTDIQAANRWADAESVAHALLRGLQAVNLIRRHAIGLKALQIYGIAQQLIRQHEHNHLIDGVERLQQMNKLGKRRPKKEKQED